MEEATEVKYLLSFFAQSREAQWAQVPGSLSPIWVDTHGEVDTSTNQPLRLLALILYSHLYRCPPEFAEAAALLAEIRTLLDWMSEAGSWDDLNIFMTTYGDGDSLGSYHRIWDVVRRLCRLALECLSIQQYEGEVLSFQYFMETYTFPISQDEFKQRRARRAWGALRQGRAASSPFPLSGEDTEVARTRMKVPEVRYLLGFFAQSREAQWAQVPSSFAATAVESPPEVNTYTNRPLLVLALILYSHLYRCPPEFAEAAALLAEIRTLLDWMTELELEDELGVFITTYEDSDSLSSYHIFLDVLRRLCRLTLESPSVAQYEEAALSFPYFVETYTCPITQDEFVQWRNKVWGATG